MEFNLLSFAASAVPESLFATRVQPPEFDQSNISRIHIVKHFLSTSRSIRVLSVVATAGSGKSTLLAEVCDTITRQGDRVCWLSLEDEDNNPALFAAYFVYALQALDAELAQSELAQLRDNPSFDMASMLDRMLRKISTLSYSCTLFLDDFQHITDPTLLSFINRFIAHLPINMRLVIASRSSPPLELSRLKVSRSLEEIQQTAINMNASDIATLMRCVHGLDLSASDLEAIGATTEGWLAGLQLAALALQNHRGPARELIDSFSGRDKDLTRYLLDCVFKHLSPDVKKFLLCTSPLRRMCSLLCNEVTGKADSQVTLESIDRNKLFLVPLDRNGIWYRYHHLFGEFLQAELQRTAPELYCKTCDRAAGWCEKNGQITEAIQYALDSRNYSYATRLITGNAMELSQKKGDHFTILEWMRRLPAAHQSSRPEIVLSHAWSLAFSRNEVSARSLLENASSLIADQEVNTWDLKPAERVRWDQIARVTLAIVDATSDQLDVCLTASLALMREIPENESFLRASLGNCIAYCHFAKRDFSDAAAAASNAYLHGQLATAEYASGCACFLLGLAELELGRLSSAMEQSKRLERCAQGSPVPYLNALSNLLKAEIAAHRGNHKLAAALAEIGKSFPESFGAVEPMFLAIRGHARALHWSGNSEEALSALLQGQDLALTLRRPRLHRQLAQEEITLRLQNGDPTSAMIAMERLVLNSQHSNIESRADHRLQLLQIRVLLTGNRIREANNLLRTVQRSYGSMRPPINDLIAIYALNSLALWKDGRQMDAARELNNAFDLIKVGASLYGLYQMCHDLMPLLEFLKKHRNQNIQQFLAQDRSHFETVLLDLAARKSTDSNDIQANASDANTVQQILTKKELRLMSLIELGMSNVQIAKELFVSEATVKWHLHNIYAKLNVRSRTAAISRARMQKLL